MDLNLDLGKAQMHLDWLKQKLYLSILADNMNNRRVSRGQVYWCDLGVGIGSEQTKNRPCVIVNNNSSPKSANTIVAPITHTFKPLPCIVTVTEQRDTDGNIILDGYVNVSEIRSVSKARFGDYVCKLSKEEMKRVDEALLIQLGLKHYCDTLNNVINDKMEYISKLNAILDEVKEKIGAESNSEISEKLQMLLDELKN